MTAETPDQTIAEGPVLISRARTPGFMRRLLSQRLVPVAGGLILALIIAAVFAPWLAPHSPSDTNVSSTLVVGSREHLLGTDQLGRDILSRMIFGARVSLMVGVIAVGLAMTAGVPLGLISGYFGGWLDHAIMRLMDAIIAFPAIILALAIVGAFGSGMFQVMVAIGVGSVPLYARLTRAQVLSVREEVYVLAGRTIGASDLRLVGRHILPNALSPLIVQGSLGVAFAILAEAGHTCGSGAELSRRRGAATDSDVGRDAQRRAAACDAGRSCLDVCRSSDFRHRARHQHRRRCPP